MRDNKGRFVKGEKVVPHKDNCECFRCTRVVWNKGKEWSTEIKNKIGEAHKGKIYLQTRDEKNTRWKGNEVGYQALHIWLRRKFGKATRCSKDITHKAKMYVWANISGDYTRDLNDWHELCQSCNMTDGVRRHKRFNEAMEILK